MPLLLGRLLSRQKRALHTVLLALMTLSACILAQPAQAGHWVLTATGSGSATLNGTTEGTFTAPAPTTNTLTVPALTAGDSTGPAFGGNPVSVVTEANLQVTITGTWTDDTSSDNTVPPGIWLSESSTATANDNSNGGPKQAGTANDGWGDPVGTSGSNLGVSVPSPNPKYVPGLGSGGSFTVILTLSANATGTPGTAGGAGATSSVGPVTIAIHAQPYNFRRTNFSNETSSVINDPGYLEFHYSWNSTDGSLADLSSETIHENVVAPSNPSQVINGTLFFLPDLPPFNWAPPVFQDISAGSASATVGITDQNTFGNTMKQHLLRSWPLTRKIVSRSHKHLCSMILR